MTALRLARRVRTSAVPSTSRVPPTSRSTACTPRRTVRTGTDEGDAALAPGGSRLHVAFSVGQPFDLDVEVTSRSSARCAPSPARARSGMNPNQYREVTEWGEAVFGAEKLVKAIRGDQLVAAVRRIGRARRRVSPARLARAVILGRLGVHSRTVGHHGVLLVEVLFPAGLLLCPYSRKRVSTSKTEGKTMYPTITSPISPRATTTRVNRSPGHTAAPTNTAPISPTGSQSVGYCTSPSTTSPCHAGPGPNRPPHGIATPTTHGHNARERGEDQEPPLLGARRHPAAPGTFLIPRPPRDTVLWTGQAQPTPQRRSSDG